MVSNPPIAGKNRLPEPSDGYRQLCLLSASRASACDGDIPRTGREVSVAGPCSIRNAFI